MTKDNGIFEYGDCSCPKCYNKKVREFKRLNPIKEEVEEKPKKETIKNPT